MFLSFWWTVWTKHWMSTMKKHLTIKSEERYKMQLSVITCYCRARRVKNQIKRNSSNGDLAETRYNSQYFWNTRYTRKNQWLGKRSKKSDVAFNHSEVLSDDPLVFETIIDETIAHIKFGYNTYVIFAFYAGLNQIIFNRIGESTTLLIKSEIDATIFGN